MRGAPQMVRLYGVCAGFMPNARTQTADRFRASRLQGSRSWVASGRRRPEDELAVEAAG